MAVPVPGVAVPVPGVAVPVPSISAVAVPVPVVTVTVLIPPMPGSKAPLPRDVRAGALKIRQVSEIMQVSVREQLLLQANSLPLLLSLAFLGHLAARFSPLCRLPALLSLPHLQLEAVWPLLPLTASTGSLKEIGSWTERSAGPADTPAWDMSRRCGDVGRASGPVGVIGASRGTGLQVCVCVKKDSE